MMEAIHRCTACCSIANLAQEFSPNSSKVRNNSGLGKARGLFQNWILPKICTSKRIATALNG